MTLEPAFALWLTGLSGSGKSAIAKALLDQLHARGIEPAVLESDVMRTQLMPSSRYDERGRDFFYGLLARIGVMLAEQGTPVIFDATANRQAYRDAARAAIPRFAEIYVDTPVAVCTARDPKGLYGAAREGRASSLPGVQAAYEPPAHAELVVRGDEGTPAAAASAVVAFLERRGWLAN